MNFLCGLESLLGEIGAMFKTKKGFYYCLNGNDRLKVSKEVSNAMKKGKNKVKILLKQEEIILTWDKF